MYAQVKKNKLVQVVNDNTLRELYPSTHFPADIQDHHLEDFDGWVVAQDDFTTPSYDIAKEKLEFTYELQGEIVKGIYKVVKLSAGEKESAQESQWNIVRYNRDNMLKATDYLLVADVFSKFSKTNQDAIVEYRQSLRDITKGSNAFTVVYPILDSSIAKLPNLVRS